MDKYYYYLVLSVVLYDTGLSSSFKVSMNLRSRGRRSPVYVEFAFSVGAIYIYCKVNTVVLTKNVTTFSPKLNINSRALELTVEAEKLKPG